MNCAICNLLRGPIDDREVLAENEAAVAWLHESRAHQGHSVIAGRIHVENLSDLDDASARGFLSLARHVEAAVLLETGAKRAILMKLGLQVPHLHLHIYPFSGDASRDDVMSVIDGEVTDPSSADEKRAFAARVRERIAKGEHR